MTVISLLARVKSWMKGRGFSIRHLFSSLSPSGRLVSVYVRGGGRGVSRPTRWIGKRKKRKRRLSGAVARFSYTTPCCLKLPQQPSAERKGYSGSAGRKQAPSFLLDSVRRSSLTVEGKRRSLRFFPTSLPPSARPSSHFLPQAKTRMPSTTASLRSPSMWSFAFLFCLALISLWMDSSQLWPCSCVCSTNPGRYWRLGFIHTSLLQIAIMSSWSSYWRPAESSRKGGARAGVVATVSDRVATQLPAIDCRCSHFLHALSTSRASRVVRRSGREWSSCSYRWRLLSTGARPPGVYLITGISGLSGGDSRAAWKARAHKWFLQLRPRQGQRLTRSPLSAKGVHTPWTSPHFWDIANKVINLFCPIYSEIPQ